MSTDFYQSCLMFLLEIPEVVDFSVVTGVRGYGLPISIKEVRMGSTSFQLKNNAPSLYSAADERTGFIMLLLVRMVPLLGSTGFYGCGWRRVLLGMVLRKK